MLAFSGRGVLKIKTGTFPAHTQRLEGFVVGFTGSKVFVLHNSIVATVDVPQSAPLYRYIENNQFEEAYTVACLGVNENDWRSFALAAFKKQHFHLARKGYIRVRDILQIELVTTLEAKVMAGQANKNKNTEALFLAEICAYQGKFQEAASQFANAGAPEEGLTLFTELRDWDAAKAFADEHPSLNSSDLVKKQAAWAEEVQDWRAAAEMHCASGNYIAAINIMGERKWFSALSDLARKLDPNNNMVELNACANYLHAGGQNNVCREIYLKVPCLIS